MMKSDLQDVLDLEAELVRLNTLVRERRKQLARLEKCPNKTCPCRLVWQEAVEKKLAGQMGKIRRQVHGQANGTPQSARRPLAGKAQAAAIHPNGRNRR